MRQAQLPTLPVAPLTSSVALGPVLPNAFIGTVISAADASGLRSKAHNSRLCCALIIKRFSWLPHDATPDHRSPPSPTLAVHLIWH